MKRKRSTWKCRLFGHCDHQSLIAYQPCHWCGYSREEEVGNEQDKNDSGYTFKRWMHEVDKEISGVCGLTSSDLADWRYYDGWQDDMTPTEVALEVLTEEGFPFTDSDRR